MGLFDFLSGSDDAERAAAANRAVAQDAFGRGQGYLADYRGNALAALGTGLDQTTDALGTGLANQVSAYRSGIDTAREGLDAYSTGGIGALRSAIDTSRQALPLSVEAGKAAIDAYKPLSALGEQYGTGVTSLLNALGVNGPGAFGTSIDQFRKTPGYQFQQDEAARAAGNKAASLGISGSGNTLQAISDRAGNIADTTFNANYIQPLSQFINPTLQATAGAASGIAGANTNLAEIYRRGYGDIAAGETNLAGGYGNLAGLYGNVGASYGNLAGAYGTNAAQTGAAYTGAASDRANVFGNVLGGQTQASQNLATGNQQANNLIAQAGMQDASNYWNLLGNIGKGVTGAFTGGFGGK